MVEDLFEKGMFREAIRSLTEEDRRKIEADVSLREIHEYIEQRMSEDDAEEFRERLSLNPIAARLVADLVNFPDLELDDTLDEQDLLPSASVRELFEEKLRNDGSMESESSIPRVSDFFEKKGGGYLSLAALALLFFGAGFWWASFFEDEPSRENIGVRTLVSSGATRDMGRTLDTQRVTLFPWMNELVLLVPVASAEPGMVLSVEIEQDGEVLWSHPELVVDPLRQISLGWPETRLEQGVFELSVFRTALGEGEVELLEVYKVMLVFSSLENE